MAHHKWATIDHKQDNFDAVLDVSCNDWTIVVVTTPDDAYLQVHFNAAEGRQHGRKWRLSQHMTRSEVVQTALMAVLAASEHEVREAFRYKGQRIFGPHFDVEALVCLAEDGAVDVRNR